MNENFGRYAAIFFLLVVIFLYLFYILFRVQILNHNNYYQTREIQNQYVNTETKRGTIYGTLKNGELYSLAEDETKYRLVVSPKDVPSSYEERLYALLNEITPIDREDYLRKIKNKKDAYEELKVISGEERVKIEELGILGVITFQTFKRTYSLGLVGARVIGFVGGGEDGFSGRYGLEKFYEKDLMGKEGVNASFFTKIFERADADSNAEDKFSKDIVTSLEPNVMKFMYKTLAEMEEAWKADEVSAIVMDTKTGKIIAMDTLPEFDPNNYKDYDIKTFGNPSVQGVYELGSIMKPITLVGAIERGLITPTTVYHDYGSLKIDNYTIYNFDKKVRGDQTMQDVISQSLNTGAVYVQQLMGQEKFKENFINFGLEEKTEIDFPGEVFNKTDNLETHTDINFANAAFGQGVAVTPISMLASLNIIPNGGETVCPHFLVSVILQNGIKTQYNCDEEIKQVISTTSAKTMSSMMVTLIDEGLAQGRYKDNNYKVGAKTGTAQLPSPDGKYYKDKFVHSYFEFFPAENPRYSILIYQVNPKQGSLASLTLAPYAKKLKDFLITYYNIPPDRN